MIVAAIVFWTCLAVCVYVYFGYPLLLRILSRVRPRPIAADSITPAVSFIVAAYNEEALIRRKIDNSLSLDYPGEKIEVIVISNGSQDRTDEIVASHGDPRVSLVRLATPGKANALNEGARRAKGEILVFTDADFQLEPDALRILVRGFADASVGGVCGARSTGSRREGDATGEGEGLYGKWDRWQKIQESRIGSVFAADGLLYAIRRSLYVPIADPDQADDIAISAHVVLQGYRLLFEPAAMAWEEAGIEAKSEFQRKIRVTHHSVRALLNLRGALFNRGWYSIELLSHKLLRHCVPFFSLPLLIANIVLARESRIYVGALLVQGAIAILAFAGMLLRNTVRIRLFSVPYYFCFVNAAAFFGILTIFRGQRVHAWRERASLRS